LPEFENNQNEQNKRTWGEFSEQKPSEIQGAQIGDKKQLLPAGLQVRGSDQIEISNALTLLSWF
jgi:hypothetical protein